MSCNWCESDRDIYNLCDNKDHSVCKPCYEKYIRIYPNILRGCPYCIGVVEFVVSRHDELLLTDTMIPRNYGYRIYFVVYILLFFIYYLYWGICSKPYLI